jgi:hypothetical protein
LPDVPENGFPLTLPECATVNHGFAVLFGTICPRTNAVVATCVELVFTAAVGAVGIPVNTGDPNRFAVFTSIVGFPLMPLGFVTLMFADPGARFRTIVVFTPFRTTMPLVPGSASPVAALTGESSDALIP